MTNQAILTKAIQKAIDGGFRWPMIWPALLSLDYDMKIFDGDEDIAFYAKDINPNPWTMSWEKLIFNHEFCKALWGEKEVHYYDLVDLDNGGKTKTVTMPLWHYSLKQMVIAPDPIQYLGEHI